MRREPLDTIARHGSGWPPVRSFRNRPTRVTPQCSVNGSTRWILRSAPDPMNRENPAARTGPEWTGHWANPGQRAGLLVLELLHGSLELKLPILGAYTTLLLQKENPPTR